MIAARFGSFWYYNFNLLLYYSRTCTQFPDFYYYNIRFRGDLTSYRWLPSGQKTLSSVVYNRCVLFYHILFQSSEEDVCTDYLVEQAKRQGLIVHAARDFFSYTVRRQHPRSRHATSRDATSRDVSVRRQTDHVHNVPEIGEFGQQSLLTFYLLDKELGLQRYLLQESQNSDN